MKPLTRVLAKRSCAAEINLQGAVGVFNSLEQNGVDLNSVVYNTVLDAPGHIISLLVEFACKEHRLTEFLSELINTMLLECVRQRDFSLTSGVVKLYIWPLDRGHGSDPAKVRATFDEVVKEGIQVAADSAGSVLSFCAHIQCADGEAVQS